MITAFSLVRLCRERTDGIGWHVPEWCFLHGLKSVRTYRRAPAEAKGPYILSGSSLMKRQREERTAQGAYVNPRDMAHMGAVRNLVARSRPLLDAEFGKEKLIASRLRVGRGSHQSLRSTCFSLVQGGWTFRD